MIEWSSVLFYMVLYAVLPASGIVIANMITKNLLWTLVKVRMFGRRRGLVLVKVHTVTAPYYRVGRLVGSMLTYKPRNNKLPNGTRVKKAINMKKGTINQDLGVPTIEVDEETNNILEVNWSVVSGHDAEATDGLMVRIAMLRQLTDRKQIIILVLVVLTFLGIIYLGYQLGTMQEQLDMILNVTRTVPGPNVIT